MIKHRGPGSINTFYVFQRSHKLDSVYYGHKFCPECRCGSIESPTLSDDEQFGGPLAVSVFLIVLSAAGENNLQTVWRVCFGVGIALPLTVFYFRLRMMTSSLYQQGAIKRRCFQFA